MPTDYFQETVPFIMIFDSLRPAAVCYSIKEPDIWNGAYQLVAVSVRPIVLWECELIAP